MTDTLRVLPLGGLGEIGKNMTVVEYDGRIIVVDTGLRFPTTDMLGIDLVLPDFGYLREREQDIEAIVVTHGHEDHVGALPWVLRELGEPGGILVASHLFGEEMHRMVDEPDRRREIDQSLQDVYRDMTVGPLACATKAALTMLGVLPNATPRLPYVELDDSELDVIRAMLERHGLLQTATT